MYSGYTLGGKLLQLSVGEVVTSTGGSDRKTINC